MCDFIVILLIMLSSGLIGGTSNWILNSDENDTVNDNIRIGYWGYIIVGFAASLTVPLLLSMLQSDLLSKIGAASNPKENFIFMGVCVVVAFSSRAFMESISEKLLNQIKVVGKKANDAKEAADDAKDFGKLVSEDIELNNNNENSLERTTETENNSNFIPDEDQLKIRLSDEEYRSLKAAGQMTARTRSGIASEANIKTNKIGEIIDSLVSKKLLQRAISKNTGGLRFKITKFGVYYLENHKE